MMASLGWQEERARSPHRWGCAVAPSGAHGYHGVVMTHVLTSAGVPSRSSAFPRRCGRLEWNRWSAVLRGAAREPSSASAACLAHSLQAAEPLRGCDGGRPCLSRPRSRARIFTASSSCSTRSSPPRRRKGRCTSWSEHRYRGAGARDRDPLLHRRAAPVQEPARARGVTRGLRERSWIPSTRPHRRLAPTTEPSAEHPPILRGLRLAPADVGAATATAGVAADRPSGP